MRYRREIDGLRAVAVVPVVLFHAGVKHFSGGFIGVDVFFVISGYLITSILLTEFEAGAFSIVRFYERRARRILPVLFIVSLSCFPLAWWLMSPTAMQAFSASLASIAVFVSNITFWRMSDYFDLTSEVKPLLHTWSLSIEEQYYLIYPILLLAIWRFARRWLVPLLVAGIVLSLATAEWGAYNKPTAAFYLLPTRAWELLIGALVAVRLLGREGVALASQHPLIAQFASLAGLGLIAYSTVVFDSTVPIPGLISLLPTIGTALVIGFATRATVVGRLLGNSVFVGVGLASYSIYLWHQPLLVFARLFNHGALSPSWLIGLLVACAALSALTWWGIERPFRDRRRFSRRSVFMLSGAGTGLLICLGLAGYATKGFEMRFPELVHVRESFRGFFGRIGGPLECFQTPKRLADFCTVGNRAEPKFIAAGDSHMFALHEAFVAAARETNVSGMWISAEACPLLLGVYVMRDGHADQRCFDLSEQVYSYVRSKGLSSVFLVGRWNLYTNGKKLLSVTTDFTRQRAVEHSRRAFQSGLKTTIERYTEIGVRVVIVLEVPEQASDPEEVYMEAITTSGPARLAMLRNQSVRLEEHRRHQTLTRSLIDQAVVNLPVTVLSLDSAFCDNERCLIGSIDKPYYANRDHLSPAGARRATGIIKSILHGVSKVK